LSDPSALMYKTLSLQDEIDKVASKLNSDGAKVFGSPSLPMPKLSPAELGFLRAVSWFHILYFEIGKISIEFLSERLTVYGLDAEGKSLQHLRNIKCLRTFLQHNLDPRSEHDSEIENVCDEWFLNYCKTPVPSDEAQWLDCLVGFLNECIEFLGAVKAGIRAIEQDESRDQILRDWEFRRRRFHAPHEFDPVIAMVSGDIGRDHIDVERFRQRHYDKWVKELEQLAGNYEFVMEARRLIERDLLAANAAVIPVTGHDIMQLLGLSPGPKVGEILLLAKTLYVQSPCSKEILLGRLGKELEKR